MSNIIDTEKQELIESFDKMNLKDTLLRGIYGYGFEKPSLIQSKAIPLILQGKDVIAQSQSGTGKTGAFTISALQKLDENVNGVQGIILAHTRELAIQIVEVCTALTNHMKVTIVLCIGGQDIKETQTNLLDGPIIVIGTTVEF